MSLSRLPESGQLVPADGPVNLATAGQTGDWVSLANFHRLDVSVHIGVGTATEDVTVTINQATDNAGAGSKALNFTEIYEKEAVDLATIGQFTKKTQTAANTYVSLTGGESEQLLVFSFTHADLDADNDFDFVQVNLSDPGSTAQLASVLYVLREARYPQEPAVSAIA